MGRRRLLVALGLLVVCGTTQRATAQVSVPALARAVLPSSARSSAKSPWAGVRRAFHSDDRGSVSALVEFGKTPRDLPPGLMRVSEATGAVEATLEDLVALGQAHPEWRITWAPPRRLLLDMAEGWTGARVARNATGHGGQGVVIGIVDTGVDLRHGDLRSADGKTRAAWLIDFSREPLGYQPDLESEYDCSGRVSCAIFSQDDLDGLVTFDSGDVLPVDSQGHGTHITSLAAGNGLSSPSPRYVGVAPEATLIIARVLRADTEGIFDSDILRAVRFIFERAEEMGMPAVVNLSLGSDFGPHDGSTALESELGRWVGPKRPGRAIVVAAGNSASLLAARAGFSDQQTGIHTEVHVPADATARVPIVIPATGSDTGYVYVWISTRQGDHMSIGLERNGRETWVEPVPPGWGADLNEENPRVTLLNGTSDPTDGDVLRVDAAVLMLEGAWSETVQYALRFEGGGTAEMWVQSEGALGPEAGSEGALFPGAFKQGTITVPGTSPDLIAVGATLNRVSWVDVSGNWNDVASHGVLRDPDPDVVAYFSSAGPTANGLMKPDIIAPGVFVAGAMSGAVDPRTHGTAGFFKSTMCTRYIGCLVVDETHGISSGTSMAAPQVSGAVALLFEEDPTLTSADVLARIQAGARTPLGPVLLQQQVGPGELDIPGALAVHRATQSQLDEPPSAQDCWIAVSSAYARPDPSWPLTGVVQLRTREGGPSDFANTERLRFRAEPSLGAVSFERAAPGMWRFSVRVPSGTGGQSLKIGVYFDDKGLAERTIPIAVDRWVAMSGYSPRGGCALPPEHPGRAPLSAVVIGGLWLGLRLAQRASRMRFRSSRRPSRAPVLGREHQCPERGEAQGH